MDSRDIRRALDEALEQLHEQGEVRTAQAVLGAGILVARQIAASTEMLADTLAVIADTLIACFGGAAPVPQALPVGATPDPDFASKVQARIDAAAAARGKR